MSIFDALGEIYKNLTVNENVTAIDEEKAEKEAEEIVMKYNGDIVKKEEEVGKTHIPLEEEKESFVPEVKVDEILAGQKAEEVKKQKDEKEQMQENQREE